MKELVMLTKMIDVLSLKFIEDAKKEVIEASKKTQELLAKNGHALENAFKAPTDKKKMH
jgi:hypothetical protein